MAGNKTYVVCRPGMLQAMQKAFDGMDVEVDDKLTTDYEFRQRELTEIEALEAELDKAEKFEADPKDAVTFVVPMVTCSDNLEADPYVHRYLAVRVQRNHRHEALDILKDSKPLTSGMGDDMEINVPGTIGALNAALKKANVDVYSISEADGLVLLEEV